MVGVVLTAVQAAAKGVSGECRKCRAIQGSRAEMDMAS